MKTQRFMNNWSPWMIIALFTFFQSLKSSKVKKCEKHDEIPRRPFPDILAIHKDLENLAETMIRCQTFLGKPKN